MKSVAKNEKKREFMTKKQYLETATKPSLFSGIIPKSQNFFMEFKPNFKNQKNTTTTCKKETYPNSHPQAHQKSKPNPNPIQTQSKANPKPIQSQSKPNPKPIQTQFPSHFTVTCLLFYSHRANGPQPNY